MKKRKKLIIVLNLTGGSIFDLATWMELIKIHSNHFDIEIRSALTSSAASLV